MHATFRLSNTISSRQTQYVLPRWSAKAADVHVLYQSPRRLADLSFTPNTLSALILPDTNDTLLAAGGQEAELHLSYYQSSDASTSASSSRSTRSCSRGFGRRLWESKYILDRGSINNSVMLTSMSFSRSHQSAVEPRIVVSNNDRTVKFFDIAIRSGKVVDDYEPRLLDIGQLDLEVPVNHCAPLSLFVALRSVLR